MIAKLLGQQLENNKYRKLHSDIAEYSVYIKQEASAYLYLHLVDYTNDLHISHDEYCEIKKQLAEQTRKNLNKDGHVMTVILYDNVDKAKMLAGDDYFCWLVDKSTLQIDADDSRVEDFYGLRAELEGYLQECGRILKSNDLKEIEKALVTEEKKPYNPPKRKPAPASILFVALNLIVFATYLIIGEPFIESGQMGVSYIKDGEYYRLLTAMFMHASVDHIMSNMIILYFLGEMMEHVVGTPKVAIIYMTSGILGNVVSYCYELASAKEYVAIGASGAVYGLMGAALVLVIYKYDGFKIPISRMVFILAFCIYSSFAEPNIDYAAHIGGLLVGFVMALILFGRRKADNEG